MIMVMKMLKELIWAIWILMKFKMIQIWGVMVIIKIINKLSHRSIQDLPCQIMRLLKIKQHKMMQQQIKTRSMVTNIMEKNMDKKQLLNNKNNTLSQSLK